MSFYSSIISGFKMFFFRLASSERSDMVEGLPDFFYKIQERPWHVVAKTRVSHTYTEDFPSQSIEA